MPPWGACQHGQHALMGRVSPHVWHILFKGFATFRRPLGSKFRFIFVIKPKKLYNFDPRTSCNQFLIAKLAGLSYFQPELLVEMQFRNFRMSDMFLFQTYFSTRPRAKRWENFSPSIRVLRGAMHTNGCASTS